MKECNKCKIKKETTQFFKATNSKDGLYSICKECKTKKTLKWREKNKEKYNQAAREWRKKQPAEKWYARNLQRYYKIDLETYYKMLISQNYKCSCCGKAHNPEKKNGRLHVDHCHKTSKVRALLCSNCNNLLGHAKESLEILENMKNYIIRHSNT